MKERSNGTINTKVVVPIDSELFAILTKEDMAGKTQAQTLELFDAEIDRVIVRIPTLPKAYE